MQVGHLVGGELYLQGMLFLYVPLDTLVFRIFTKVDGFTFLVTDGESAGCFTNTSSTATKIAVSGKFIGPSGIDGIAPVELFNAPAPAAGGAGA